MAKFQMTPTVGNTTETARIGTKTAPLVDADKGKAVSLAGMSQVDIAASGDDIYGVLSSVEVGTRDGFAIGGVQVDGFVEVDTGALAFGTVVVADTSPAKGVAGLTKVKAGTPKSQFWVVVEKNLIKRV